MEQIKSSTEQTLDSKICSKAFACYIFLTAIMLMLCVCVETITYVNKSKRQKHDKASKLVPLYLTTSTYTST